VRLVGLLGLVLLTLLVYYALRRAAFPRWLSAAACVSIASLVSMQVYVSWAAIAEAPYVAALAGLASLRVAGTWRRRAEAAALLLVALLTYQPAAMFFWVFTAVDVLRPGRRLRRAAHAFVDALAVGAVAMSCSYVAVRIGVHFWGGTLAGRTTVVHDVVGKVRWFWNEPLVNGLALFNPNPALGVSLVVAVVVAGGLVLLHAEQGRAAAGFLALAAAFVPLSYLPNLAIAENFASYRSISALAALLAVYLWLGLWGIVRARPAIRAVFAGLIGFVLLALVVLPLLHPERQISFRSFDTWPELLTLLVLCSALAAAALHPRAVAAGGAFVAAVLVVGGLAIAARDVTSLVVDPQAKELELMRADIKGPAANVVFVKPNGSEGAAPLVRYDELGAPSTYFPFVPLPAVDLLIRERGGDHPRVEVFASDQIAEARKQKHGVLVDMRALERQRGGWSVWTTASALRP
jgi:hypothetical protein